VKFITPPAEDLANLRADPLLWEQELDVRPDVAEAIEGAEEGEEVGRLQARRSEAEGDRRDHHRKPAELEREQELADELAAVGERRAHGRDQGLPGQDDHVADLLEEPLDG
jgi:hypothetical protein